VIEKSIKKEGLCQTGSYRAWYRCTNCGVIFQHDLKKGTPSAQMNGHCPWCGVKSGTPKIGSFPLVKFNPAQDLIAKRNYFM